MPRVLSRILVYAALIVWTVIALFPIYWTFTTAFKVPKDVLLGHWIPWVDYTPSWLGFRAVGLSPDTIFTESTLRAEFLKRFWNSIKVSVSASLLGLTLGSAAAYGLSRFRYRWKTWKNRDISIFFLSQLIIPPVVLAMPFLVFYKALALLDSTLGLILLYTLSVLPIVIWVMKGQFDSIPRELDQAALIDGCSIWSAFFRIILPLAIPGMVVAFILSLIFCWNEYFFAALITSTHATTLPVMIASQTGSQGIAWWSMAALACVTLAPLIAACAVLENYVAMRSRGRDGERKG